MDELIFSGLLIFVFVILPLGVIFLFYFIPKRLGSPKTGKILGIATALCFVYILVISVFGDAFFTEKQAADMLAEQEIILNDKFEIEDNKSTWAIGESYHTFTLNISGNDKLKVIKQIKESSNFKVLDELTDKLSYRNTELPSKAIITSNYETKYAYVTEYFQAADSGYAPTFRRISIDKTENKLIFEDINE